MNPTESEVPWIEADEWEGDNGLQGNRAGLQALRDSIDQILERSEDLVPINVDLGSLRVLKLCDPPPDAIPPETIGNRIGLWVFLAILISIPLLALFGLSQLIQIFFS